MDRFEAMRMLLLAVDSGSLSAAGRQLRVPLPTLSRKISDLEALLGTRLLVRTTRRLTLTDPGLAYVQAARSILERLDEAEREAAGEFTTPSGELALSAPLFFGRLHVLPVVSEFLAAFPDITIRLALSDRNTQLADDHIDMAVRIGPLPDSAMVATRIGTMRTILLASPALLARYGIPASPEALSAMPCVSFDMLAQASSWRLRAHPGGPVIEHPIRPHLSVSTAEAALDAAIAGVGVTRLLHYQAEAAIASGALRIILPGCELAGVPVSLVHATRGRLPMKMRRFLDFAAPRLKQRLAALDAAPPG